MTEQQIKVSCPGCGTKFHVPEYLVRGKQINFRCRRCRGTIPVDGRTAVRDASPTGLEPSARLSISDGLPTADMFPKATPTLETPAGFAQAVPASQRTHRRTTDAALVVPTAPLSTAPPIAMSKSEHFDDGRSSTEVAPFSQRSIRGKKYVVASVIVVAAGFTIWSMAHRPASPTPLGTYNPARDDRAGMPNGPQVRELQAGTSDPSTSAATLTNSGIAAPHGQEAADPVRGTTNPTEPAKAVQPASRPAEPTLPKSGKMERASKSNTAGESVAARPSEPAPQETAPSAPTAPDTAQTNEIEFNTAAAREALESAGQRAASCRTIDTPAGAARVAVTFAPNGSVTSALIESGPLVGTPAGTCVASKFRSVHVPVFTGDVVTVHKTISF